MEKRMAPTREEHNRTMDNLLDKVGGSRGAKRDTAAMMVHVRSQQGGLGSENVGKAIGIETNTSSVKAKRSLSMAVVEQAKRDGGLGGSVMAVLERIGKGEGGVAERNYAEAIKRHAENVGFNREEEFALAKIIGKHGNLSVRNTLAEALRAHSEKNGLSDIAGALEAAGKVASKYNRSIALDNLGTALLHHVGMNELTGRDISIIKAAVRINPNLKGHASWKELLDKVGSYKL